MEVLDLQTQIIFSGAALPPADVGAGGEGAPPSNTAPSNCITPYIKVLRYGIDSLYLSYQGTLSDETQEKLNELKALAQSIETVRYAQLQVGDHIFEVRDKGRSRYAFVLIDNCFEIQLSNQSSTSLPMAYVKVSSEYLSAVGCQEAEGTVLSILHTLGAVKGGALVSRADLFLDYCGDDVMQFVDPNHFICRARTLDQYYETGLCSGFVFGRKSPLSTRIYNKTREIEKSCKTYLCDYWKANGWGERQIVWRVEFQLRREALETFGVRSLAHILSKQYGMWAYLTQEWLRLAMPNNQDDTRSRWPVHPLWEAISHGYGEALASVSQRVSKARLPSIKHVVQNQLLPGLTSVMAMRNVYTLREGMWHAQDLIDYYFANPRLCCGKSQQEYLAEKLALKHRRFNTRLNPPSGGEHEP